MISAESESDEEVLFTLNGGNYIPLQDLDAKAKPEHLQPIRSACVASSFANLFKCYTGAGILTLPFAFRYSGLVAGVICLVMVSFMCTISMLALVRCKNKLAQHSSANLSYSDVVLLALGRKMSILLDGIVVTFQLGAVIIYFVFVSENLTPYFGKLPKATARWYWMLCVSPVYIGLSWIRTMKYIGGISFIAETSILTGIGLSAMVGVVQMSQGIIPGAAFDIEIWPPWRTLPLMFGMAGFAFEGAAVVIPTESSMREPKKFSKVLVITLLSATLMYMSFGVLMYCAFGSETGFNTGQITENIEQFAQHMPDKTFWLFIQTTIRLCLVVGIGMSVSVQLIVVLDIFEKELFKPGRLSQHNMYWKQNLFRAFVVLCGLALAASGISFGHMVSLTGAFSGTLMQFIFPIACYLKLFRDSLGLAEKCTMYFIALCGTIFGVLGTYITLSEMFS